MKRFSVLWKEKKNVVWWNKLKWLLNVFHHNMKLYCLGMGIKELSSKGSGSVWRCNSLNKVLQHSPVLLILYHKILVPVACHVVFCSALLRFFKRECVCVVSPWYFLFTSCHTWSRSGVRQIADHQYEEHVLFVSNQIYYWVYKCTTHHYYTNIIKTI